MKSFKSFVSESEHSWNVPKPNWIGDNEDGDHIHLYHGTHARNLDSVKSGGITHPDPHTGLVSFALDPHTAKGYAAMSGAGGEANFRKTGGKPQHVPDSDRHVHIYKVPKDFVRQHMQPMRGHMTNDKTRLTDKNRFTNNVNSGLEHPYQAAEVRFSPEVSAEMHKKFYQGHMVKK